MPIDPRISLGVQPFTPPDVLGGIGKAMSLADMAQTNQMRRQVMQQQEEQARLENEQRQRAAAEDAQIREALSIDGRGEWGRSTEALRRIGSERALKMATDIETAIANQRTAKLAAEEKELEIGAKKAAQWGQIAGSVNDEATFATGLRAAVARGLMTKEQAAEYLARPWDESLQAEVKQIAQQSLTVAQQAEQRLKALQEQRAAEMHGPQLTKAQADASLATATAAGQAPIQPADQARLGMQEQQLAETKRHNRILEARGDDKERLVQVAGPNGEAIWVRESEAVGRPAAQAARSITGQERQALAFYNRMKESVDTIAGVEDAVAKAGIGTQARLTFAPNWAQSEQGQIYNQARRAFTEARLRKESGAAIPEHEYKNDERTYFAQPGDTPKVIEQKRKARENVMNGVANSAGRAYEEWYGEPLPKPGSAKAGGAPDAAKKDPLGIR